MTNQEVYQRLQEYERSDKKSEIFFYAAMPVSNVATIVFNILGAADSLFIEEHFRINREIAVLFQSSTTLSWNDAMFKVGNEGMLYFYTAGIPNSHFYFPAGLDWSQA